MRVASTKNTIVSCCNPIFSKARIPKIINSRILSQCCVNKLKLFTNSHQLTTSFTAGRSKRADL